MTDETFNGWTSRPTWALALHLDNNEGDHTYWRERANEWYSFTENETEEGLADLAADLLEATDNLAQELESWLDELYEQVETAATSPRSSPRSHPVTHEAWLLLKDVGFDTSTSAINYHEIARHWVDEIATEAGQ